jgi:hypothetical protein
MTPADAPIGLGQLAYAPPGVPGAPVQLVVCPGGGRGGELCGPRAVITAAAARIRRVKARIADASIDE